MVQTSLSAPLARGREGRPVDRTARRARQLAWVLWTIGVFCIGLSGLFILASFSVEIPSRGFGFRGWVPIVAALWLTIGARIAARQPRLNVGWLLLAVGFLWSMNAFFEEYATFAYYPQEVELPLVPQVAWFNTLVGSVVAGLAAFALMVIPDGRLPSRRWLPLGIAVVVVTVFAVVATAVIPRRIVPFPFQNPFGIEGLRAYEAYFPTVFRALDLARGLEVLLPTAVLLLRLRSAVGPQRQQLKWVALAASFASITVFAYAFVRDPVVQYAQILGLMFVPISFGIAMRRYRLYDIDRILDRTIVLGGATALLAGLYTAGIGLMQRVFIALTGERSDAAVILTTLLVAAAFTPVKDRIQAFVKRFSTDIPGTKGIDAFTAEIDEHLRLSDRNSLLSQLLAESVSSTGAISGALEVADERAAHALRTLGPWTGETQCALEVCERDSVAARVLLGPRANGEEYDDELRERLDRATRVVGLALERIGPGVPYAPAPQRP